MSFFANQKLAVRLGVAFGALAVGLLVVAAIGFSQMGTLRSTTEELNDQEVGALGFAAAAATHSVDIGQETANHLYVHDGDLEAQDEIALDIAGLTDETREAAKQLGAPREGHAGRAEVPRVRGRARSLPGARRQGDRALARGDRQATSRSATARARCTRRTWPRSATSSTTPATR